MFQVPGITTVLARRSHFCILWEWRSAKIGSSTFQRKRPEEHRPVFGNTVSLGAPSPALHAVANIGYPELGSAEIIAPGIA